LTNILLNISETIIAIKNLMIFFYMYNVDTNLRLQSVPIKLMQSTEIKYMKSITSQQF